MNLHKQTIDDLALSGKRVIIRADFNVPLDDSLQITDDTRIRSTLPTINRVVDDGGKVILCSHLGRPKGKFDQKFSLAPIAKRLGRLLGTALDPRKQHVADDRVGELLGGLRRLVYDSGAVHLGYDAGMAADHVAHDGGRPDRRALHGAAAPLSDQTGARQAPVSRRDGVR